MNSDRRHDRLSLCSLCGVALALLAMLGAAAPVWAEGSFQFGLRQPLTEYGYTAGNIPRGDRPVFVDIANLGETINVSICGTADSDTLRVEIYDSLATLVASQNLASSNVACNNSMSAPLTNPFRFTPASTGTYSIRLFNTSGTKFQLYRWDVTVTPNALTNPDPTARGGRVWALDWSIEGFSFSKSDATDANLYVLTPGGSGFNNYVWQLDLNNMSGFGYSIIANEIGVNPPNSGYSVNQSGNSSTPLHPIYLSYPAVALPSPAAPPTLTGVRFIDDADIDKTISPNTTPGVQDDGFFEFTSDVSGIYWIVIDTDRDGTYEASDRRLTGHCVAGLNRIAWDGRGPGNSVLPDATYPTFVQVRIGEYHFVAQDIETSGGDEPGLTIYEALSDVVFSDTQVYWDDQTFLGGTTTLPAGLPSTTARHTWGNFTGSGFGDNRFIDTYVYGSASEQTTDAIISSSDAPLADNDGDGIDDSADLDDDNDGIRDSVEGNADTDGDGIKNSFDIDSDNDGIVDNIEAQGEVGYVAPSGLDTDNDGLDNAYDTDNGGSAITPVNTDGADQPDYLDLDSDNDTVPDTTEGHDANHDGQPDRVATGSDSDNDGLDNAFDTVSGFDTPGNATGSNAPLQNTDGADNRDWRDTDDDNDGKPTKTEDSNADGDPTNDDTNGNGTPDYLENQPPVDTDSDGVNDNIDVDDDDDGILDVVETNTDTDGDGIPNRLDIDSDNDGITDTIEAQGEGSLILATSTDTDGDGLDNAYDTDNGGTTITPINTDGADQPDYRDLDSDNDTVPDRIEGHDANHDGIADRTASGSDSDNDGLDNAYDTVAGPGVGNETGTNAPLQNTDGVDNRDWRDTDDDNDGRLTTAEDINLDGNLANDDSDFDGTPDYLDPDAPVDTDRDGVPNVIDLDDDNDGILDSVEGNGDTDGDGIANSLDIDADNDGIVDNVEAQSDAGYRPPSGNDTDNDGLDNAYDTDNGGTPITVVNTDGADQPDYLDLDSDNDTVPDRIEGHDANHDGVADRTASGTDADSDGLDDAFDTVNGFGPGNAVGSNAPLQNTDGIDNRDWRDTDDDNDGLLTTAEDLNRDGNPTNDDSDADGTPDYLDTDIPVDTDRDGVPNVVDLDDDNDGILDSVEGNGDTDGDGIANSLDIDADNDGIVDNVEAQSDAGYRPPSGNDTDNDGLDNAYDTDNGGTPITVVNTDGADQPDYLDLDSDNDTVPDRIEGHDANHDGVADRTASGTDADSDGLDDAFDTVNGFGPGNAVGSNAPLQNTDGIDNRDWRDTDDDNDGRPTTAEDLNRDGNPTNDDSDADGTPDYLDTNAPLDTDRDGVPNVIDLDDDNDGILDTVEGNADPDGDGIPNSLDIDSDNDGIVDNVEAQSDGGYRPPSGVDTDGDGLDNTYDPDNGGGNITPLNTDGVDQPDYLDLDSDNDTVPDRIEGHDADHNGIADRTASGNDTDRDGLDDAFDTVNGFGPGNATGSNAPLQNTDGTDNRDWRDTNDDNDSRSTTAEDLNRDGDPTNDDSDGDGRPDYLDTDAPIDTDRDGVPNVIDLDDDNDGILDSVEGNGDTDGDGIANSLDIDADNDGIVDNVEAQSDAGYRPPSGNDTDNDGLDNAYDTDNGGTPITVVNTDGADQPDYLDLDSDNDTVPDRIEGHDADHNGIADRTASGNDADRDGLDDAFDTVNGFGPGNAVGSNAPLQNTDGVDNRDWRDTDDDNDGRLTIAEDINRDGNPTNDDSDGDGRPDYLDVDAPLDTDRDGVVDTIDVDDDDDGILDTIEGNGDLDGDGIPNRLDIDADNDGIVDNVEAQGETGYRPPSGNDTDNDGLDNAYDTDNGGTPITVVNTDGADQPDYLDLDSDNDTVPDRIEGHDADHNGIADRIASGTDADSDGLDDAFDTVNGFGPGNETGSNAPLQNSDDTDNRDWRDTDDDNDGLLTKDEDANEDGDPTNDDTDDDGRPDYLDLPFETQLIVRKEATVTSTTIGGLVPYTITVSTRNASGPSVSGVTVSDSLPAGFKLIPESPRLVLAGEDGHFGTRDDVSTALTFSGTRPVVFGPFSLSTGEPAQIRYALRVGTGVIPGSARNIATPLVGGLPAGRAASATVTIEANDPIFDRTTIIGKVFNDKNGDGMQTEGEDGVPGVRIATVEGLVVETDPAGRYHLADIDGGRLERGRNVILKLDPATLPPSTTLTTPNPRVVHITQAIMAKINFGVRLPEGSTNGGSNSSLQLPSGGSIWLVKDPSVRDPRLDVTAPIRAIAPGLPGFTPLTFQLRSNYSSFIESYELLIYRSTDSDLARPIKTLSGQRVGLDTGVTWDGSTDDGSILHAGDSVQYVLRVRGQKGGIDETAAQTIGFVEALKDDSTKLAVPAQIAQQPPAKQTIRLTGDRVRIHGEGLAPGAQLQINKESVPVDGAGKFVVEQQVPTGEHRYEVEVAGKDSFRGNLDVSVDDKYFLMVGLAELTAGKNSVSGNVEALSGDEQFDETTYQTGRVAMYLKGKIKGRYLLTAQLDSQEEDLGDLWQRLDQRDPRQLFRHIDPDRYYPVYGDDSTTISDVDSQGRFYLRLDWDQSEAVVGNFHTNFTGTELGEYNRSLSGGQLHYRSSKLTTYGDNRHDVSVFASQPQSAFGHNEFLGTGGSLYYLKDTNVVIGSEKVWVEVRDRDSDRVIERLTLERGRDYEVDELQGRLILTRPLAQVVDQLDPSLIKDDPLDGNRALLLVDYEYVPLGFDPKDASFGARASTWVGDKLRLGATHVTEGRRETDYQMSEADVVLRGGKGTFLKLEYAQTDETQTANSFGSTDGGLTFSQPFTSPASAARSADAISVEGRVNLAEMTDGKHDGALGAWWREREAGFSTARLHTDATTTEYGAEARWRVGEHVTLSARGASTEIDGLTDQRFISLQGDYRTKGRWTVASELRRVEEQPELGDSTTATLGAVKLGYNVKTHTQIYGIAQSTLSHDDGYRSNDLFTVGVRSKVGDAWGLRGELSSGDRGDAARVGVDWTPAADRTIYMNYTEQADRTQGNRGTITVGRRQQISNQLSVFNESQFGGGDQPASAAHVFGLNWKPTERWQLGATVQRSSLDDQTSGGIDRDAAGFSLGYLDEATSYNGKLEYRDDDGATQRTQWLVTNFFKRKITQGLSLLGRFNLSQTENSTTADEFNDAQFREVSFGFAYRPAHFDRVNLLGKYTLLYDLVGPEQSVLRPDQRSRVASLESNWQLSPRWSLGTKFADRQGKVRENRDRGAWFVSDAFLGILQVRFDVMEDWNALVEWRNLTSRETDDSRSGALVALYRGVGDYVKLGLGYNFTNYSDDLTDQSYEQRGWFVKLLGKF